MNGIISRQKAGEKLVFTPYKKVAKEKFGVNSLLSLQQTKAEKSNKSGKYFSRIQHLSPSDESGVFNTCPFASKECKELCLNTTYRMRSDPSTKARINRTAFLAKDPQTYFHLLAGEILATYRKAEKLGKTAAIRLNGTSDIRWEKRSVNLFGETYANIYDAFPEIIFYDYTKFPLDKMQRALQQKNYHFVYSLSEKENSISEAKEYQDIGINTAAVFRDRFPKTFSLNGQEFPTINGDLTDLIFTYPKNHIISLLAKGKAKYQKSSFVISI